MLDIHTIREKTQEVADACMNKGVDVDLQHIIRLDRERKDTHIALQEAQRERNTLSKEEGMVKGKKLKEKITHLKKQYDTLDSELADLLLTIPNIPHESVPLGSDEAGNLVVREWGDKKIFDFEPKDHLDLGLQHGIIDIERATKVSGSRFGYIKGKLALLELALVQYAFETLVGEGFIPLMPPVLIQKEITTGLGYWNEEDAHEYYLINEPGNKETRYYLTGTAEHSVVPYHKNETLNANDLPLRYVAFSPAFRREAGTYGKDTRGIFRVHQFDKVEMVSFTLPQNGYDELEYFLSLEEKLFQMLGIPHRVVAMCTGDLGFPQAKKYDIEAWIPSQNTYREMTSTSTTTDFQARRLQIKYRTGDIKDYVHILNGTAFAIGRTLIAIMENYQMSDGSISVPEVLQKYCRFDTISSPTASKK